MAGLVYVGRQPSANTDITNRLIQGSPYFSIFNISNSRLRHIKFIRQNFMRKWTFSYVSYIFNGELSSRVFLSYTQQTSLLCFIYILLIRSRMKMSRLNTNRSITRMQNKQVVRYFGYKYFVRGSVCSYNFLMTVYSYFKYAVSIRDWPFPVPTPFSIGKGWGWFSRHKKLECFDFCKTTRTLFGGFGITSSIPLHVVISTPAMSIKRVLAPQD